MSDGVGGSSSMIDGEHLVASLIRRAIYGQRGGLRQKRIDGGNKINFYDMGLYSEMCFYGICVSNYINALDY